MSKISILFCFIFFSYTILSHGLSLEDKLGIYEIKKGDFSVNVTNYGAIIMSVVLPDKHGKLGDIVLGYDTAKEYLDDEAVFGAIVGRVANRISGAQFTYKGTVYKLFPNDNNNTLHGGKKGFSKVIWEVKKHRKSGRVPYIALTYKSADGEEGFPGEALVSVTYSIPQPYKLSVRMRVRVLGKTTPINLLQHTYWNLGGHNSGDILSDELQISASYVTPLDANLIPTGKIMPVKGTPYDFLKPQVIKGPIKPLLSSGTKGYNINYAVDGYQEGRKMRPIAVVRNKKSGRVMKLSADTPGVQLYTANNLNVKGKGGFAYKSHAALCLETQGFPDAVNHPNFPSVFVKPGSIYEHNMVFAFSIQK